MKEGSFVKSIVGRDNGKIYIVYKIDGNIAYLVNGDYKKQCNPKKKNIKHIKYLDFDNEKIAEKIANKSKIFDEEIYSAIKNYYQDLGEN